MPPDHHDIAFFVLALLSALALISFVWAGVRVSEIRSSSLATSVSPR